MFSIAAINDTDSRGQWEPLAPTKEAQEFHLSQIYHEGLLKLQAKEYEQARELLETVLKNPLISNFQADNNASDGHLLQLRFLVLKNLATVFLQQGSTHYESALHCYLQAVEIDTKDSVVWNQLGTLACSMGLLSISRWAFEQGLFCSPNNWNCMEKLLEVLIAIGDEVACHSVAELILRHWPSHSRASHVKNTIEESEPVPFAPRGIDKLEPKHVRLKFLDKRKATSDDLDEVVASKRLNQNRELRLAEASWMALASALLSILCPPSGSGSELGDDKTHRLGDVRLSIQLPYNSENVTLCVEMEGSAAMSVGENTSPGDCITEKGSVSREKDAVLSEDQAQERRSSRLERLRSRKPGKEESDFSTIKDLAKVVMQFLEPFIVGGARTKDCSSDTGCSLPCVDVVANPPESECGSVARFVQKTSKNYGAYHVGHLLLEEVASNGILYQEKFTKFLELEKLTRHWGLDRTPECSLFLAELYYDFGSCSSDTSNMSDFMSEASYHLCKIIESVALDYPFPMSGTSLNENCDCEGSSQSDFSVSIGTSSLLSNKHDFWIRFFWLSGRLSIFEGNNAKAREEFCISLSLLTSKENKENTHRSVCLPHCKIIKGLTIDRIIHEINLLEVDYLLKNAVTEMIEKDMYSECVSSLAPLLFSTKDVHIDVLCDNNKEGEAVNSVEISALDVLIKACEQEKPMNTEVLLNCHRRKLQILMAAAGVEECGAVHKTVHNILGSKVMSVSETESKEGPYTHWLQLVGEEVKAISRCASQLKNSSNSCGNHNGLIISVGIIGDIQSLLLALICNIASMYLSKKSSGLGISDQNQQRQICWFIDAAIAFCKLQHLNPNVPVKTQIELIVATHDMLAEYGLCCAGGEGEGEEGTFLKLAIKHLLALDMKLKSNFQYSNKVLETAQCHEQLSHNNHVIRTPLHEPKPDMLNVEMNRIGVDEATTVEEDTTERMITKCTPSHEGLQKENIGAECGKDGHDHSERIFHGGEKASGQSIESGDELTEEEREELELGIDNALDQCFFCLYGLNLRSESSYEDDLAMHKNTSRGDYQTKEQCADVFQYILPYAKASSRTGLIKLRRVLRAIRKHFPRPPDSVLTGNSIEKFLDDPDFCEDKLSEEAGSDGFLESILKMIFPGAENLNQQNTSKEGSSEPYLDLYCNLYYLLAQSEEMNATDKWPGFVLTNEGEEFVEQNANLFKYDLLYNPLRFESWQRLANIYDEEVDLLLNDGSKQINVAGWRKNAALPMRVETSRRRSRRCLLVTLALAKTAIQQGEIHELLALVYYDGLQNVVPFYDQRFIAPSKDAVWMMFCQSSMRHFKKAFTHKEDWSHALYLGKLSEKLGHSHDISFSYYDMAIALNPSAVDPFYRMHASRLKLLCTRGKQNEQALKIVAAYSFTQSTKETVSEIFGRVGLEISQLAVNVEERSLDSNSDSNKQVDPHKLEKVWNMLYEDCLSALQICVEGELKHFHKARYMLAQGLYKRAEIGDLGKAKEELSFCFKSSRSSFTINMWEIDSMVKKGRRKLPGPSGNRKTLEVNLAESSRKFITCIRKYLLFYLKLLEETGDIYMLERAYISIRADKRFSLCLEDLVPVALGRYIKALVSSMQPANTDPGAASNSTDHVLEKMFSLFLEQVNLWSDICSLPEIKSPELAENSLSAYLYQYIHSLERNVRLETLEGINEKIRKRLKNPKLSNSHCAKVYRHVSIAWCRSLVVSMAMITPLHTRISNGIQVPSPSDNGSENTQLLCVDLQTDELWNSSFEDLNHLKNLGMKWNTLLSKVKNVIVKKAPDEDLDTANTLLRSAYNFYRDTSCAMLPSGISLYMVPSQLATEIYMQPGIEGGDILDMSTPLKLLLWAYALLFGRCPNISLVVKYCEENAKSRMKRGGGISSAPSSTCTPSAHAGAASKCIESEAVSSNTGVSVSLPQKESPCNLASASLPETAESEAPSHVASASLPESKSTNGPSMTGSSDGQRILSDTPHLLHCNNIVSERRDMGEEGGDLGKGPS